MNVTILVCQTICPAAAGTCSQPLVCFLEHIVTPLKCIFERRTALLMVARGRTMGGSRNLRKGADPSRPLLLPLSLSFPFPPPLKCGPLNQLEGFRECCKLLYWGPGQSPGRKRIRCNHFEYSEYHVLQYNDQNLALAKMTVSDGVSPSPKERGRSRLGPPLNPPLITCPESGNVIGTLCDLRAQRTGSVVAMMWMSH